MEPMEANDKRMWTQEGFLLADANIGMVGPLMYQRSELRDASGRPLDGDPNSVVTLHRSRQVLEEAIPTMTGAPVTIDHPPEFLTTSDYKEKSVGGVATLPTIDNRGMVKAKVRIGDETAIQKVKRGEHQLSPGFGFVIDWKNDNEGDIVGMQVNHIAIVEKGRAGHQVRILDSLPPNPPSIGNQQETNKMSTESSIKPEDIRAMVGDVLKEHAVDLKAEDSKKAIEGIVARLDAMDAERAKQATDAAAKEAETARQAEDKALIEKTVQAERARYTMIQDALPFIAEDQREGIMDKDAKSVLVMAVGDSVQGADAMSEDRLLGLLQGMAIKAKDESLPPGVVTKDTGEKVQTQDERVDFYAKQFAAARGNKENG